MNPSDTKLIRLIAVFKLLKAALLIGVGVGAFHLLHKDMANPLEHWVARLGLDPGNQYVERALQKVINLTPQRIKGLGLGSFLYAGLFLTEGIGLWLVKRWAEWLTVIITGSLIPVEVYEIWRRPTAVRASLLVVNIAVVAYLLWRIWRTPRHVRPGARRPHP